MQVRDLTQGKPLRLILAVALPLMLGNVFQQLYTVVDAQVVGGVEGVSALAALGASDWFNWMLLGIIQGLAQGFTIPMAQAFGAKDFAALRKNVGNAAVLAVISALVLMAAGLLLISPVLTLMATPQAIRPMAEHYLTILFLGIPVVMAYNLLAGTLRALGDGKSPLYAMVVASLVNIGLDVLFVAGFGWGVGGAAVATVLAQLCSCVYCVMRLARIDFIRPARSDLRLSHRFTLRLLRLGVPVAAQNGVIGVGGMIVQTIVNPLGVAFIAGYTATNKLYGILEIAAISFGYAMTAYAGQNLGAGKTKRIWHGVHTAVGLSVAVAAGIGGLMMLFGHHITASFISGTPDEVAEATRIAREYLCLMSAGLPLLYILHVYRSTLQGMGNTVMPMASGFAEFVMRTGAVLLLPGLISYWGVFWAELLAWAGADVILVTSFYLQRRRMGKEHT